MPKNKVGRNDLCPCGSGKKYKKCCLNNDNSNMVYNSSRENLMNKLTHFLFQERFNAPLTDLFERYILESGSPSDEVMDDAHYPMMINLALFDSFMEDDKSTVEIFYEEERENLTEKEREILADWLDLTLGIYEMEGISDKREMNLKNLLIDERPVVLAYESYIEKINKGDILIARVAKIGSQYQILGSFFSMPFSAKQDVLALAEKYLADYRQTHKDATVKQFLRDKSLKITFIPETISKSKEEEQKDDVIQLLVKKMSGDYTDLQIEEAQTLWKEFEQNNKKYISKPEKWAAAVEYIVSRSNLLDISKEEIGGKYKIPPYAIISRAKIIEKLLSL